MAVQKCFIKHVFHVFFISHANISIVEIPKYGISGSKSFAIVNNFGGYYQITLKKKKLHPSHSECENSLQHYQVWHLHHLLYL